MVYVVYRQALPLFVEPDVAKRATYIRTRRTNERRAVGGGRQAVGLGLLGL